jgi:hypothetical protein
MQPDDGKMTESHPPPERGWSAALWPRNKRDRIGLNARLLSWRWLIGFLGLMIAFGFFGGLEIYLGLYGEHHHHGRWDNPILEIFYGIVGIVVFVAGSACVTRIMIVKLRIAPKRDLDPDYERLNRLLPVRRDRKNDGVL